MDGRGGAGAGAGQDAAPRPPASSTATSAAAPKQPIERAESSTSNSTTSGEPRPPRTNTHAACDRCKARKTRCNGDGINPCPFCRARNIECVYTWGGRQKRPNVRQASAASNPGPSNPPTGNPSNPPTVIQFSFPPHFLPRFPFAPPPVPWPGMNPLTPPLPLFQAMPPLLPPPNLSPLMADSPINPRNINSKNVSGNPGSNSVQATQARLTEKRSPSPDLLSVASTLSSLAASLPSAAPMMISDLYPSLPSELLPPLESVAAFLQHHVAGRPTGLTWIHPPSFMDKVKAGTAYPPLLLVFVWSGYLLAPITPSGARSVPPYPVELDLPTLEDKVWSLLSFETERICVSAEEDIDSVSPDDILSLLQALFAARSIAVSRGPLVRLIETSLAINELTPLARFGLLEIDRLPRPTDRALWITAEERCRAASLAMYSDVVRCASLGQLPTMLPVLPGTAQPHLDCAVQSTDPIPEVVGKANGFTLRRALTWASLPRGSVERRAMFSAALPSGLLGIELWARALYFRARCKSRGIEPYEDEGAEKVGLVWALEDFVGGMPEGQRVEDWEAASQKRRMYLWVRNRGYEVALRADGLDGLVDLCAFLFVCDFVCFARRMHYVTMLAHLIPLLISSPLQPQRGATLTFWSAHPTFPPLLYHARTLVARFIDLFTPPRPDPRNPGWTRHAWSVEMARMVTPAFAYACGKAGWTLLAANDSETIYLLDAALSNLENEGIGWKALKVQWGAIRRAVDRRKRGEVWEGELEGMGSWVEVGVGVRSYE